MDTNKNSSFDGGHYNNPEVMQGFMENKGSVNQEKVNNVEKGQKQTKTVWLSLVIGLILLVVPVGLIVAKKAWFKKPQAYPVNVADKVVCYPQGGIEKKYDSDTLVVENNLNRNVKIWVQWNMCTYDPNNPPKEGYQCNEYVKRNPYIIGPNARMTFSPKTAGSGLENVDLTGKVVQIDANTDPSDPEGDAGGCFRPDGQQWEGGLAFTVKAYPAPTMPPSEGKVVCYPKGGMEKKYDSDTIVIENKKDRMVQVWVQWNKCSYDGKIPPDEGYQCNEYVKRNPYDLGPGQKIELSVRSNGGGLETTDLNCAAVQIDASTVKTEDGGCYLPDEQTPWSGGIGFTIKAYQCQTATLTPTPTPTPKLEACSVNIDGKFVGDKYQVTITGNQEYIKAAAYVCGGYNQRYCDSRGPAFVNSYWLLGKGGYSKDTWVSLSGSKSFEVDYQCGGSIQVDVNYCKQWSNDGSTCVERAQCAAVLDKAPDCPTPTVPLVGTACYQGVIVKLNGQPYNGEVIKPGDKLTFVGKGVTDKSKNIDEVYFTIFKDGAKLKEGKGYDLSFDYQNNRKIYSAFYDFVVPEDGYGDYQVSVSVHEPTEGWFCTSQ